MGILWSMRSKPLEKWVEKIRAILSPLSIASKMGWRKLINASLLTALYEQTVVYQSSPFNCGRKRLQNTPSVTFASVHVIDIGGIYF